MERVGICGVIASSYPGRSCKFWSVRAGSEGSSGVERTDGRGVSYNFAWFGLFLVRDEAPGITVPSRIGRVSETVVGGGLVVVVGGSGVVGYNVGMIEVHISADGAAVASFGSSGIVVVVGRAIGIGMSGDRGCSVSVDKVISHGVIGSARKTNIFAGSGWIVVIVVAMGLWDSVMGGVGVDIRW